MAELTDGSGNLIVAYTYDATGRLIQKDMGNGTRTVYAYDADGEVLSITNSAPDHFTVNSFDDYTYDELGNMLTDTNQDGEWTYSYDADSQLIHAVFLPNVSDPDGLTAQDLQYAYEPAGNRISETVNGVTTTYVTNNVNEYTSSTTGGITTNYQWDANGNLIEQITGGATSTYTYSDLNQLTAAVTPSGTSTYQYDPLGNLVATASNGQLTQYLVDPTGLGNVVGEFDGSGNLIAHYTNGLGLTSRVDASGAAAYYDFNAAGSTLALSSARGTYANTYSYAPFGEQLSAKTTIQNPFTFIGEWGVRLSANGLELMGARTYSTVAGAFIQPDPLSAISTVSLYDYAGNNPVAYVDPAGLDKTYAEQQIDNLEREFIQARGQYMQIQARIQQTNAEIEKTETDIEMLDLDFEVFLHIPEEIAIHIVKEFVPPIGIALEIADLLHLAYEWFTEQRTPGDPNDITGPGGYGSAGFVPTNQAYPYTIQFQNEPSATAPAQVVQVTEALDPNLDWSTFQLGDFGFGDIEVVVPPGLSSYSTRLDLRSTLGIFVNVSAGLNLSTGVVTWTFTSIDPSTLDLPSDILTGFLPPDVNPPEGEAFVNYMVRPKATDLTGTVINAQATVVFDLGLPDQSSLATAPIFNTLDAGAPTSSVNPLPPIETSPSFTATWSGQDDPGGSGIAFYDIYDSEDGGPYSLWQSETTDTSATFTGHVGHTYSFYSVATDNVGNVQPTPATAQQTVEIVQAPTATDVTPGTATVNYGQSATFTATVSSANGTPPDGSVQFLVNGAAYGNPVAMSGSTAQLAITEPAGSYTIAAQYTGDADYAATLASAETTATLTVSQPAAAATNLAISPNTGISAGLTDTGTVTFTGNLPAAGMTVDVFDTSTNTGLGNATVTGTSFSLALNLAEGSHVLRARDILDGTYADAFFTVLVDLTPATSHVVNSLGASQSSDTFPVSVAYSDPAGSGGAPASGVSSVDLYVSVNNGPFSLYQTQSLAPAASGTVTFNFVGQDRNLYAFHSVAHDAAGNTESKSSGTIEATTSVPDLHPPVTHILATNPSYSWNPFPSSEFSGLTPSSYSNGVFTINWAGADPDANTGTPAGSIALVNIYVQVDGGAPVLIGQPTGGTPNGSGVYSGSITYNALADGLSHTYSFYSVGVDDEQLKQYAPQAGPAAPDVTFSNVTYTAALGIQNLVVEKNIAERSFIQYLDVDFNQSLATSPALKSLAAGLTGSSRNSFVELVWYGENLTSSSTPQGSVNLFNAGTTASLTLTGNDLSINFGANGLTSLLTETGVSGTGSPTSSFGDGWYALGIDPNGNPSKGQVFWVPFFRLLGDTNGDGVVTGPYTTAGTDAYTVYHAEGQSGSLLNADVNGDGTVNSKDLTETVGANGHAVGATPPAKFPQFQLFAGPAGAARRSHRGGHANAGAGSAVRGDRRLAIGGP